MPAGPPAHRSCSTLLANLEWELATPHTTALTAMPSSTGPSRSSTISNHDSDFVFDATSLLTGSEMKQIDRMHWLAVYDCINEQKTMFMYHENMDAVEFRVGDVYGSATFEYEVRCEPIRVQKAVLQRCLSAHVDERCIMDDGATMRRVPDTDGFDLVWKDQWFPERNLNFNQPARVFWRTFTNETCFKDLRYDPNFPSANAIADERSTNTMRIWVKDDVVWERDMDDAGEEDRGRQW